MSKLNKILFKIILSSISIGCLWILIGQIDLDSIKNGFVLIKESNSIYLYILLSLISLLARSERFYLLNINSKLSGIKNLRLLIIIGTAIRNISMNFVPLRAGELSIPAILKLSNPKEQIGDTLHPIWISMVFDIIALLLLGLSFVICSLILDFNVTEVRNHLGTSSLISILLFGVIALTALYNFNSLSSILIKLKIGNINFKIFNLDINFKKIITKIPNYTLSQISRLLLLSLVIRVSKYISLSALFFSISETGVPSYELVFFVIISFIIAELASSLPGSGVMGFGGYELVFQYLINHLAPELKCTFNLITSIHLVGFVSEISIATIAIIFCLIVGLFNKK